MDISKINLNGTEYNLRDVEALTSLDDLNDKVDQLKLNMDLYSYGVEWDVTVASSQLTRIGNPTLHRTLPIQSAYRGCVVKDGVFQYYLDPLNWAFKEDGSPSVLDGTDGDVYVHTPKFYYRSFIEGNKRQVRFSIVKIDDTWSEMPEAYVGAYRTALDRQTDTARTVVNTTTRFRGGTNSSSYDTYLESDKFRTLLGKPATAISRGNMRTYARKNGTELLSYDLYKVIFCWAYVIEYANFNALLEYNSELTSEGYHLGGLGAGVSTWSWNILGKYNNWNPITPCGYGDQFGNNTGIIPITTSSFSYVENEVEIPVDAKTFNMPRWRGFDNPFGDIWTNLDGIITSTSSAAASDSSLLPTAYIITDSSKYTDNLEEAKRNYSRISIQAHDSGYIKDLDLDIYGDIIPNKTGGSDTTYMSDYYSINHNNSPRTLLVGGRANHGSYCGPLYFASDNGVGVAHASVGFRTIITL